jgi:hypothetical protein
MEPAAALAAWLDRITFTDFTTDQVIERIIDEVAGWGSAQGWRVYRRAPSVVTLPPPLDRQHSVLDIACARPDGPPLAIEVDHTDRRRTVDKLLAEADAGRIAIWVRWGRPPAEPPPPPVRLVTVEVTRRAKLHTRTPDLPAPAHGTGVAGEIEAPPLLAVMTAPDERNRTPPPTG